VGLALSGQNLSVPASVGFIALFGIALLNQVLGDEPLRTPEWAAPARPGARIRYRQRRPSGPHRDADEGRRPARAPAASAAWFEDRSVESPGDELPRAPRNGTPPRKSCARLTSDRLQESGRRSPAAGIRCSAAGVRLPVAGRRCSASGCRSPGVRLPVAGARPRNLRTLAWIFP
jgi:hypothetical protein